MPTLYRSTSEAFGAIPITTQAYSEWRTVYCALVADVCAGDTFTVYGEGQVRNDAGINVELAQAISVVPAVYGGAEALSGLLASPVNGWNITPDTHYGRFSKGGSFISPQDYPLLYFCLRVRARSSGATGAQALTVNAGQGFLDVVRF